jgi:hypothetical protein
MDTIRFSIDEQSFRELVKGQTLVFTETLIITEVDIPTVEISLDDIGFDAMLHQIKQAMTDKDIDHSIDLSF